jgi:ABC-2 type transport system ATP-binding protein
LGGCVKDDIISVKGLVKHFGPVKAVDGIDFEVKRGECFGLLGRNGAGKSTTIKMLIGLLPPDAGEASINGHDLKADPLGVRSSIGYVAQSLSVDGVLTGRQNLDIFGKLYNLSSATRKERIPKILQLMDLEEAADRPVGQYSGGMIRRLEIGQSILHEPPLVFLDEPTVGMDPVSRNALWAHIRKLQKRGDMSILLTTHYMEEAEELCTRLAIMDQGKIVARGSMAELRKLAKKPKASLDQIFVHFTGHHEPEHKGDLRDVQRSRRIAKRLG